MARVRIDPPAAGDREDLLALTRAGAALHRPWTQPPLDDAGFDEFLERSAREDVEARLVRLCDGGELAGVLVLSQIFRRNFCNAYLGYYGSAAHAGRGLMSEGLALVLDEAFGPLGLHRVEANVQPGNAASLALIRRAGFRREGFSPRYLKIDGEWRDHERWAILAEDRRAGAGAVRGSARGAAAGP